MSTLTISSAAFADVGIEAPAAHDTAVNSPHLSAVAFKPAVEVAHASNNKGYLLGLAAVVALLHGAAVIAYLNYPATPAVPQPKVNKVEIQFIKPKPPEVIEPPKPPPPPPKAIKPVTPPAAKPAPALRTAVAQENIPAEAMTIPENRQAPVAAAPVAAAPVPEAPPAKVEEPITEATGNAAYLNNPPPEYPAFAQRQGWEGKVLLRVHVLANGKADKVEIKQSSGRKTLDESATNAVKYWTFVPSKRGSTAIDGWATVPIEFKLAK